MSELYEAYAEYYEQDNKVALEALKELSEYIKSNPKAISEIIDDIVQEENLCPDCFEELETFVSSHEPSECMGREVYEEIYAKKCPNCGRVNDE